MSTYSITLNERSASGKAALSVLKSLESLGVFLQKIQVPCRKNFYEQSQEDIKHGRVETFSSPAEMFQSLGI